MTYVTKIKTMANKQIKAEMKNFKWYIALNTWRASKAFWKVDELTVCFYKHLCRKITDAAKPVKPIYEACNGITGIIELAENGCGTMVHCSDVFIDSIENKMQQNWKAAQQ